LIITNANVFDRKWEEVDHDLEDSVAGALTSPTGAEGEGDPLGLGAIIECVFSLTRAVSSKTNQISAKNMDLESSESHFF